MRDSIRKPSALELAKAKKAKQSALDRVRAALETMRSFIDRAQREIDAQIKADRPIDTAIATVMHALAWGQANASSDLQDAMRFYGQMLEYRADAEKGSGDHE